MKEEINARLINKLTRELKAGGNRDYEIYDTKQPGLVLRVRSGKMSYSVVYTRGKRMTLKGVQADAFDHARVLAKQILLEHADAELLRGDDPIQKRKKDKAKKQGENYQTFLDVYRPYLVANLRNGINNAENVKETMDNLTRRFPEFHELALSEITPFLIERWRQRRMQEGVKPSTINRQMNDLRACLNRAVHWGALETNPFTKVEPCKIDRNPIVRFLTAEEESRLRKALDAREAKKREKRESGNEWRAERGYPQLAGFDNLPFVDYLKPAVLLAINTGLRRSELLEQLTWSKVDLDRAFVSVIGEGANKGGQTRHVPLNAEALEVLKQWKECWKHFPAEMKSIYVFPGKDGKPIKNPRKAWVKLLDDANIKDFRWHDQRHTFGSNVSMETNGNLYAVNRLLGHTDFKTTQRYAHLSQDHLRSAVDSLDKKKRKTAP